MCNIGIYAEDFNPQVLYVIRAANSKRCITQYHSHDFFELSIILSGSVEYTIDNNKYIVKQGDLLLFNPGTKHQEHIYDDTRLTELHIGLSNFRLEGTEKDFISAFNNQPIIRLKNHHEDFFKCCEEIIREQEVHAPGYDIILKTIIMKMFILILRDNMIDSNTKEHLSCSIDSSEKQQIVKSIIEYMKDNYMNNISLDKIARNMYLSRVYISKIFKEETGDSPINYLIQIRLSKAKDLLEKENLPIKTVANNVGYPDAYYFSKLFKKYYGYSPSQAKIS